MSPLLAALAERSPRLDVPDAARAQLAADRDDTTMRNLVNLAELKRISRMLADKGIATIALKGVPLLELVYRDIGLRPMLDLDLLVTATEIARAEELVLGLDYKTTRPPTDEAARGARAGKYSYPELVRSDRLVRVDLHRELLPDAALAVEGVWARAVEVDGFVARFPSTEDLVLHLALHFFRDRLRRTGGAIGQLADLAWTSARLEPDWTVVVDRAESEKVGGRLFLVLDTVRRLVGPWIPPEVLTQLRPRSYTDAAGDRFVARRVFDLRPWHPAGLRRTALRLVHPRRVRADVRLDRWMDSLAGDEERNPASTT